MAMAESTIITSSSRQLFVLASEEKWNQFQEQLQSLIENGNLDALQEPCGELAPEPVPPDSSILHVVCSFPSVPSGIVQTLLTHAPPLATTRDELGRNPLHIALVEGAGQPTIIRLLARSAPEAAQQRDDSYCTPIEVLAQMILMQEERSKYVPKGDNSRQELRSKVARLWNCVQPLAVASTENPDWESPLLHACLRAAPHGFPYALMERARKEHYQELKLPDSRGNYPLHIIAGWDPEDDVGDFLRTVANQYPAAAKTTNEDDLLPLDIGSASGMRGWNTGIAQLLEVYPAPERFSLAESSYLLARAARQQRSTLIFELLRSQPEFFNR